MTLVVCLDSFSLSLFSSFISCLILSMFSSPSKQTKTSFLSHMMFDGCIKTWCPLLMLLLVNEFLSGCFFYTDSLYSLLVPCFTHGEKMYPLVIPSNHNICYHHWDERREGGGWSHVIKHLVLLFLHREEWKERTRGQLDLCSSPTRKRNWEARRGKKTDFKCNLRRTESFSCSIRVLSLLWFFIFFTLLDSLQSLYFFLWTFLSLVTVKKEDIDRESIQSSSSLSFLFVSSHEWRNRGKRVKILFFEASIQFVLKKNE